MELLETHRNLILQAAGKRRVLVIRSRTFSLEVQEYLEHALYAFLIPLGMGHVKDQLLFCLKELGVNAKKANVKRLYFRERGLSLESPEDYAQGMAHFKGETLGNQSHYLEALRHSDYYVKFEFTLRKKVVSLAVKNNAELLEWERQLISDKLEKAQKYETLQDAFTEVLDETEGAGLGLVVMLLMLKNLGYRGHIFRFYTHRGETVARITLPLPD